MKGKLGWKIITDVAKLRPKMMTVMEIKTQKRQKKLCHKMKMLIRRLQKLSSANQIENEIKHLEKNIIEVDRLQQNHKELLMYNVLTEEIDKIALRADDNRSVYQEQENKCFSCFNYKILFCCTKKY